MINMTEAQRRVFAPRPFDAKDFCQKLAAFADQNPDLAARAFANAAIRTRYEAAKPENARAKIHLQLLAGKMDALAAETVLPETHWESGEIESTFADNLGPYPTEYDALVHEVGASKIAPDGSPNSDLMSAHVLQKQMEIRERGDVVQVQITPASAVPGATMFGNQALVQFGGSPANGIAGNVGYAATGLSALQEAQVIRWDGKEQEAQNVTISISRVEGGAGATWPTGASGGTNYSYRPFFRVLWGTSRAQPNEAIGDAKFGVQFTVSCAFLYVNVGMDAPQSGRNPGSMVLAGQIGFSGNGRNTPVMRTQYIDALAAAGTSAAQVIPRFATGLLPIQVDEITTGACQINWRDEAATVVVRSQLLLPGSQTAPIPIPDDCYDYTLVNQGSATARFRLMWALSL